MCVTFVSMDAFIEFINDSFFAFQDLKERVVVVDQHS